MPKKHVKPWFDTPPALNDGSKIAIIGGGISGLMIATHLTNYFDVTLIEEKRSVMSGASGNPAAILDPYIALNESIEKEFYSKAYEYAWNYYSTFPENTFNQCGLLKVPRNSKEQRKFSELSTQYPTSVLRKEKEGLFFPNAGYINPKMLGENLANAFEILLNTKIVKITYSQSGTWTLFNDTGNNEINANAVIICNSYNSANFEQTRHLEFDEISGQISYIKTNEAINRVFCSHRYITPPIETRYGSANICGATFDRDSVKDVTDLAHTENIQKSPIYLNDLKILGGRREIRAMTNDHLPNCGPLPNFQKYLTFYEDLHHGPTHKNFPSAPYHNGLYISVGLGSRGFLSAPILGAYMTSLIRGKKSPINVQMQHALHPARFIIRKLSKK